MPLARALLSLVQSVLPLQTLNLVIDDTLALRHSPTAAGSAFRHDHAHKTNRPDFVQAQCWVTLGVSVLGAGSAKLVLPILSRLVPNNGNRNKLTIALALLRVLEPVLTVPVRLLCDSWFMRGRLVLPLRQRGIHVIAQARIDTALFLPPTLEDQPKRGRKLFRVFEFFGGRGWVSFRVKRLLSYLLPSYAKIFECRKVADCRRSRESVS